MKNINDLIQETHENADALSEAVDITQDQKAIAYGQQDTTHHQTVATDKTEEALTDKMAAYHQQEFEEELKNWAQMVGLGYINLTGIPVPPDVLQYIPFEEVKEKKIICFYFAEHRVARLATLKSSLPEIEELRQEYAQKFKLTVEMFVFSEESFNSVLKQYEALPKIKPVTKGVSITQADLEKFTNKLDSLEGIQVLISEVSATETVAAVIAAGLKTEASDIHVEAEVDGIKLRYRVDGVLHTAATLPKEAWQKLISRLKLLSDLKLNVTEKPQDGRFSIFLTNDKIDVRVSTLPTSYGESVVMRLLMSKVASLNLEDLGLEANYFQLLNKHIARPNGMIITTGPTGSGKTTTLYAILNKLNKPETKIITIEDPVEYEIKGVNQSQVDANKDYTFAKGLRSIVRQDPDIVMVGEMRDLETVDIALNAALTGHLVLSTLHTNNAAGAIPRFLSMGAKPYLLAPALNLIIAQRLVRKLCVCKKELQLDETQKTRVQEILNSLKLNQNINDIKFYGPVGCDKCNKIGYKGRIGVFEMFEMNKEIEDNILSNQVSESAIKIIAMHSGMRTLAQDGLLKVIKGVTSLEEVLRVVGE